LRQQRADLALQRRGERRFASASFASFHNMAIVIERPLGR
jgi:hypothetical protein